MKNKTHFIIPISLFVLSSFVNAQAVFAPVKGAVWNYYFRSNNYSWNIPFFKPVEGIATIKYVKDTLIGNTNFKKMERIEKLKYRGNDTIFLNLKQSLLFIQRNDSIFLLTKDTLSLAFVYPSRINSVVDLKSLSPGKITFSLTLKDTGLVFALNRSTVKFKNFTFIPNTKWFDVYLVNPLIILDKIGALNSDVTVIESQGENSTYAISYRLICYEDFELGLLKFDNRECDVITSIFGKKETKLKEINIVQSQEDIRIKNLLTVRYIRLYNILGQLVNEYAIQNIEELTIPVNVLHSGIYLLYLESETSQFQSKKILITN